MLNSVKAWCTIPVELHKSSGYLPNGEVRPGQILVILGYVAGETVNIIDNSGHDTTSSSQIYFPGNTAIADEDEVRIADEVNKYTIKKIKTFYDGNTGIIDMKVVYL